MKKKIVVIDLGSTFQWTGTGELCKVTAIDLCKKEIHYAGGWDYEVSNFDSFSLENFKTGFNSVNIKINGIPLSEIEEVRIAGYNDKVTLKVGDTLSIRESENPPHIVKFEEGRMWSSLQGLYNFDGFEEWYVNGKRYHRDDIIIPTESHQCVSVEIKQNNTDICASEKVLQIQDNEMIEITPKSIEEVLGYNNIDEELIKLDSVGFYIGDHSYIRFDNPTWLQHIEIETGKLKPLPKPNFDFEEYINQHITVETAATLERIWHDIRVGQKPIFSCAKENADILIEIAKLSEELKYE